MKTIAELLEGLSQDYGHALLAFVGEDGYPTSVATTFAVRDAALRLDPPAATAPREGIEGNVLFSHIRPRRGMGYDERRYVSFWGTIRRVDGALEITPARVEHWDEKLVPFFEYSERGVPRAHRYMERLSAERGVAVRPRLSAGWLFLRATRLPFLTATWVSVFLGLAIAAHDAPLHWGLALLTLVAASAIHLGLNVANDVFDTMSGADAANLTPTPFSGGSRVIVYRLLSLRQMIALCAACYAMGLGIGLYLALERGFWPLAAIGAAGAAISLEYTAPPLRLVHRGLGEIAVLLGFGLIMTLGAYYVQAQRFSWPLLYASLPVGILIALVLYVNEIPDRRGDELAGKRTLPVRLPRESVIAGYGAAVIAAFGLIVAGALLGILPPWTLLSLAAAPLAVSVQRALGPRTTIPTRSCRRWRRTSSSTSRPVRF